jgi:hypothetical protein
MTDQRDLLPFARELRARGQSVEEVLRQLRDRGASMGDCVRILRQVEGVSLGEAKRIVDESEAWADRRLVNQRLRKAAARALETDTEDY